MLGDNLIPSLLGGIAADQQSTQNAFANQATQARIALGGPIAADPAQAVQLQNYFTQREEMPYLVTQESNKARLGGVDANVAEATQGGRIASDNSNYDVNVGTRDARISQANSTAAQSAAQARVSALTADQADAAQETAAYGVFSNALDNYLQGKDATDPKVKEDAYNYALNSVRATVSGPIADKWAAPGSVFHQQVINDPVGAMKQFGAMVQQHRDFLFSNMDPKTQAEYNKSVQEGAKANAETINKIQETATKADTEYTTALGKHGVVGAGVVEANNGLSKIDEALKLVDQMPDDGIKRDLAKYVGATNTGRFESISKSIKDGIASVLMQGAKQIGEGNYGLRNLSEFQSVSDQFGTLDPSLTKAQLRDQLLQAKAMYQNYGTAAQAQMSALGDDKIQQLYNERQQTRAAYDAALHIKNSTTSDSAPGGGAAAPAPAPQAGAASAGNVGDGMALVRQVETGNRDITQTLKDKNSDAGTPGQGFYQIIDPTWKKYAAALGVDIKKYPTAKGAPREIQDEVARTIPANQWGPNTQDALKRQYPGIDLSKPLGMALATAGEAAAAGSSAASSSTGAIPTYGASPSALGSSTASQPAQKTSEASPVIPSQGATPPIARSVAGSNDPATIHAAAIDHAAAARQFAANRQAVMDGRALVAKYLRGAVA